MTYIGALAIPENVPEVPRPDESVEPSAAADKSKSNWKSTASATAKLLLRGVRDSADAFGPLKSVAGGLCFILESCEVWSSYDISLPTVLIVSSANKGKQASNRIIGTPGQSACWITLCTCC